MQILICDGCGKQDNVRHRSFLTGETQRDPAGENEHISLDIDLCLSCELRLIWETLQLHNQAEFEIKLSKNIIIESKEY